MKIINKLTLSALLVGFLALTGCDKTKPYDIKTAEPEVHFAGGKIQNYNILTNPAPAYTITVGTTDVSDVDREVTFQVTPSAGAVAGTDYTVTPATNKLTIPAGQATATITVQGNYSSYLNAEKDTLTFTLKEPSVKVAGFQDTIKLAMRGPCAEIEITQGPIAANLAVFAGAFNARESGWNLNASVAYSNYGPYPVTIGSLTPVTATTATFRLTGIYEVPAWAGTFTLNWTDLADRRVTVASNMIGSGTPVGLGAYNIYLEPVVNPATPPDYGTFSFCSQTITVRFMLGAYSVATGVFAGYLTASTGGGAGTFAMTMTR